MTESEFQRLIKDRGYTPAQIALLKKAHGLSYKKCDLPRDESERGRIYAEAIGRFNLARRNVR